VVETALWGTRRTVLYLTSCVEFRVSTIDYRGLVPYEITMDGVMTSGLHVVRTVTQNVYRLP